MSRMFFDQIDDELRGLLGPSLRGYHCDRAGRLLKVWYSHPAVHFEVQSVGRRWSPLANGGPALELGLHLEHPDTAVNERLLGLLDAGGAAWRRQLPAAVAGPAIGPAGGRWRRVSEFLAEEEPDDPDLASEAAERLATYVRALWPLLRDAAAELEIPGPSASR